MARFRVLFPGIALTTLTRVAGTVTLDKNASLTADMVRDVDIDQEPPALGDSGLPYPANYADDCTPPAQYIATGIRPFRFDRWSHLATASGYHTYDLTDYLSMHGCDVVAPTPRPDSQLGRFPARTLIYRSFGFSWANWMAAHGIGAGRYDQMPSVANLADMLGSEAALNVDTSPMAKLMMDLEQNVYAPAALRTQTWYPGPGINAAFEQAYYTGYAATHMAMAYACRQKGYKDLSVYGWFPMPRSYYNLQSPSVVDWSWSLFGQQLYDAFDTILVSVYFFYWMPYNLQYALANIDYCYAHMATQPVKKPLLVYCTSVLQGGTNWWTLLPVADEEYRALALLTFFTGATGTAQWNYAAAGNSIVAPQPLVVGDWFMLDSDLVVYSVPDGTPVTLHCYDTVQIDTLADGIATFRVVNRASLAKPNPDPAWPEYSAVAASLLAHVRTSAAPIAAFTEGLAMAKVLEHTLADGALMQDQTRAQLLQGMSTGTVGAPIIRRRKLAGLHVICTYDPEVLHGRASGRMATVTDFDGVPGLTLQVPADDQVRLYLLQDAVLA